VRWHRKGKLTLYFVFSLLKTSGPVSLCTTPLPPKTTNLDIHKFDTLRTPTDTNAPKPQFPRPRPPLPNGTKSSHAIYRAVFLTKSHILDPGSHRRRRSRSRYWRRSAGDTLPPPPCSRYVRPSLRPHSAS
jgi:hypothetical protein